MKTEDEIRTMLDRLISERGNRKAVTVDVNAPLALMQLVQESKIEILRWVLSAKNKR